METLQAARQSQSWLALRQPAIAQNQHVIAQFEALVKVVRHQYDGRSEVRAHLPQDIVELGAERSVETARSLWVFIACSRRC